MTSCRRRGRRWSRSAARWATPPDFEPGQLDNDYRRTARRARAVVERVFYAD